MNTIALLVEKIKEEDYRNEQFAECSLEKNILFVNPQLCGKDMYRMIVPYISMIDNNIFAGLTNIEKYNEQFHLLEIGEIDLQPHEIIWADCIVIPFTTVNLCEGENNLYGYIRQTSPDTKIIFLVDFNFYELSKEHPFYSIFNKKERKASVEKNILAADEIMVSNLNLQEYMLKKISEIAVSTYKEFQSYLQGISCIPFMFDLDIMFENIEYNPEKPTVIQNRKIVAKIKNEQKQSNNNNSKSYVNKTAKEPENKAAAKKSSTKKGSDKK